MKMRETHMEKMKELNAFKIFFVDECATNDAMVPLYGRAPKGERAVGSKPRAKGNHRTVVGALSGGKAVWARGAFVAGVPGVFGGGPWLRLGPCSNSGLRLCLAVGSGDYVLWCKTPSALARV